MCQELEFLGGYFWYFISIGCISVIAFGLTVSGLYRGALFLLFRLALSGAAQGNHTAWWPEAIAAAGIGAVCMIGIRLGQRADRYVPVELQYAEKSLSLTALRDSGNTLRDPVTGNSVLVVGADAALKLTGLTRKQLQNPVESMGLLPGLRLVPYRTVGQSGGLLLALQMKHVKIGSWQGSSLVAFAPEGLDEDGHYQALTGGAV